MREFEEEAGVIRNARRRKRRRREQRLQQHVRKVCPAFTREERKAWRSTKARPRACGKGMSGRFKRYVVRQGGKVVHVRRKDGKHRRNRHCRRSVKQKQRSARNGCTR